MFCRCNDKSGKSSIQIISKASEKYKVIKTIGYGTGGLTPNKSD